MKVRDLFTICPCDIWITLKEDPNDGTPDIKISADNREDAETLLSDEILDHEIYLMIGLDDVIYVSLFLDKDNWDVDDEEYLRRS